jgi:serine/threonine protein kinase
MALSPGTRLGVYEVTAQIGEGGMGQVFRAHDTRLNRDVALKILPDAVASDPDRLASRRSTVLKNPAVCAP